MLEECKLLKMLSVCDYNNAHMNCAYALRTVCFIVILSLLAQGIPYLCNGQESAHGLCQKGTLMLQRQPRW